MPEGPPKITLPLNQSLHLLHPYNATLVSTKTPDGQNNVMTIAWIIPTSVDPPLITMSVRKSRFSYKAIQETGEFVVNIPTFDMAEKVLRAGRTSGKNIDKFAELPFIARKAKMVKAPLIEECVAHLECKLWKTFEAGDHDLIIGEIIAATVIEGYFTKTWDITKFRPVQHTGQEFFTTCSLETVEIKF
ncbi:MAG: flavin reductase family protein [Candidatus Hermodarchaeota archaeon]|nr:flavin reductase family protein [Candidatus Hermodarchaeota archaeon]